MIRELYAADRCASNRWLVDPGDPGFPGVGEAGLGRRRAAGPGATALLSGLATPGLEPGMLEGYGSHRAWLGPRAERRPGGAVESPVESVPRVPSAEADLDEEGETEG